ncbi:hypothetical protein [Actinomadura montaniterrae]|uniref:Uncharacterized protein n=1 Tax=Actinomadura montaniterrae TaxID=1803903 RepID=A0A6L3W2K1_9ACTN|nr:hypothetical protein [Actinomadura montaniterrae]KAB2384727.1 hypothetical protein F9B16_09780 [Actinomadura montaniterrae]
MSEPLTYGELLGKLTDAAEEIHRLRGHAATQNDQIDALTLKLNRAERERQHSDELLVGAHNDLCEALDVRHRPLLDVIQHAAVVRADRDRFAGFIGRLRELAYMGGQDGESVRHYVQQAFAEFDREANR